MQSPLYLSPFAKVWKASYTISASIFVDVPYWPPYSTDKSISCVVQAPLQWFFHRNNRASMLDVPESPIASSSGVTPCIVMKNDWVLYHQVSSFSLVVLQKHAVVDNIYLCLGGTVWCSITSLVSYTFFGRGELGCFHSFDWCFKIGSYEQTQVSSMVTIRHLSFGTGPTRSVRLHSSAIVAPWKFHEISNVLQV